jgi:integrative and conjugative element protein (TIGR02256 family)
MACSLAFIYELYFNTKMEGPLEFWSVDLQFGLRIEHTQIKRIVHFCKITPGKETGGILIGYYTNDLACAVVTTISGPPLDSIVTHTRFYRGIVGLQGWIDRLWRKRRHYYLGEWHFHPSNKPSPSPDDIRQMVIIASMPEFHSPEPILLIAGYDPSKLMPSECLKAYVFKGRQCVQLHC